MARTARSHPIVREPSPSAGGRSQVGHAWSDVCTGTSRRPVEPTVSSRMRGPGSGRRRPPCRVGGTRDRVDPSPSVPAPVAVVDELQVGQKQLDRQWIASRHDRAGCLRPTTKLACPGCGGGEQESHALERAVTSSTSRSCSPSTADWAGCGRVPIRPRRIVVQWRHSAELSS